MDSRVELLLEELGTLPPDRGLDFEYWRERFQLLFKEKLDDESRQTLLQSYKAVLDLVERSLVAQGRDPTPFQEARAVDWNTLCMQEALHRSGTDVFHPDDLNEIVQREVALGRMAPSDFTQLAEGGAKVLGKNIPAEEPKKGLWRRLFG